MQKQQTKFKQTEIGEIPEDWEVKEIQEVSTKLGDGLHGTPKYTDNGDYYFINGNNLTRGKVQVNENTKRCANEEFKKYKKELNDNTLMVSINGTLGNIAFYRGEKIILGKSVCYLNVKREFSILYIKHILSNNYFQNYIQFNATGTTIKNISLKQMREFKFGIPKDIKEQFAIAKILSDIDAKIEANQQMNKILEAIGQAIFKKWFIDEKKDEWEDGFFGDGILTEILGSGIKEFSGEKVYVATADVENSDIINYKTKVSLSNRPSRANMQPIPNSVWFAKMKETRKVLIFDDYNHFEIENLILSTGFTGLKVKPEALYYIWNFINSSSFEKIKDNLSIGTTMQGVNNDLIQKIKIPLPDEEILKKFNYLVKNIYFKIYLNNQQNKFLVQTCDSLLPKLMSGKIRVPLE